MAARPIVARMGGGYFFTLRRDVLDKLNYLRGPGDSFSDVILALAKDERV
jgi:hypothetical protein